MSRRISLDQIGYLLDGRELPESGPQSDNSARLDRLKRAVRQVIRSRLTERQREVLLLYYFEGKNIPQIAAMLGRNKSTVSRTLSRAVENVKRYVEFYSLR